jgi:sarcosine oxidase
MSYDVIVIGLGGMGSAAACRLALRGQRVLGLEQFRPLHDRGSSHGYSRIIRQSYFEHPDYVPLLRRAYDLWQELEVRTGETILTLTGGLMIGPPNSAVVQGSIRSAVEHHLPHEILNAEEVHRRFPPLTPAPSEIALYETQAGIVRPEAGIRAHLAVARSAGAELHFQEPVTDWEATTDGVTVTTAQGTYRAARLVIAPGAWASHLFQWDLPLKVTRQVLHWFEPVGGIEPFLPDRFPVYIWEKPDGDFFYGFPAQVEAGVPEGVKVAIYYRPHFTNPDNPDRVVTEGDIADMREMLLPRIPTLPGPLQQSVTCLYTSTPDGHFVVGRHPLQEQVILASPCSGHGYKFCSVMGEILADLATVGEPRFSIDLFSLERFSIPTAP